MDKREIKGIILKSRVDFIITNFGEGGLSKVVARLRGEAKELMIEPKKVRATGWYGFKLQGEIDDAICNVLAGGDEDIFRRMGAWSAEFQERMSTVKQFSDPWRFLTMHSTVFSRFYRPGRMELIKVSDREARMRLHGFMSTGQNCITNMGFISRGIEMAGAEDVTVEEIQCTERDGVEFDEYRIKWR